MHSNRRNFTLLEVTIASLILVIGILSLVAAISVNARMTQANKEMIIATNAASQAVQTWLSDPLAFRTLNTTYNFNSPPQPLRFVLDGLNPAPGAVGQTTLLVTINPVGGSIVPTAADVANYNADYRNAVLTHFEVIAQVVWSGANGVQSLIMHSQRVRTTLDEQMEEAAQAGP